MYIILYIFIIIIPIYREHSSVQKEINPQVEVPSAAGTQACCIHPRVGVGVCVCVCVRIIPWVEARHATRRRRIIHIMGMNTQAPAITLDGRMTGRVGVVREG